MTVFECTQVGFEPLSGVWGWSVFETTPDMVDAFDTEQRIAEDETLQSMGFGRLLWVPLAPPT